MARIVEFRPVPGEASAAHGPVDCGYRSFSSGGEKYLQLDTYGSPHRAIPGKVSQSIQLDRAGAAALCRILMEAFPGLTGELNMKLRT